MIFPSPRRNNYYSLLRSYTPDDHLHLKVLRGTEQFDLELALSTLPDGYLMAYTQRVFGFTLAQGSGGLLVQSVVENSAADRIGMRRGDLVVKLDGRDIASLAGYRQLLEERLGRLPLSFTIVRDRIGLSAGASLKLSG